MVLTGNEIDRILKYDGVTGKLYWKERADDLFAGNLRACRSWNARFAGREAFTSINNHGYVFGSIFGKGYTAHRVIWCLAFDYWPTLQIDHINGDRADNRLCNLREVDNSQNHKNQKAPTTNTSGVVGVYMEARTGSWVATIYDRGIKHHIGTFAVKRDAIDARRRAELIFGYHANHGREDA